MPEQQGPNRQTIGIVAIVTAFFGGWGIHKFMMGFTTTGIIQVLLSCCGVGGIIGLVEGIIYLTKTDEEFYQTYIVGQKQWF